MLIDRLIELLFVSAIIGGPVTLMVRLLRRG